MRGHILRWAPRSSWWPAGSPGVRTAAYAESNGDVKVVPLGDSITDGITVPGGFGDPDHEGHSGWRPCNGGGNQKWSLS